MPTIGKIKLKDGTILLPTTRAEAVIMSDGFTPLSSFIATTTEEVTLLASSWSGSTYTISNAKITATSYQEMSASPTITSQQLNALQKANIIDGGQSIGSMTLKAFGTVPVIDIPIKITYRGEK